MIDFFIFFDDSLVFDLTWPGWPFHSWALVGLIPKVFGCGYVKHNILKSWSLVFFELREKEKPKYGVGLRGNIEWLSCCAVDHTA